MTIPLPPDDEMRQMRFTDDFWKEFVLIMNDLIDNNMIDPDEMDTVDEATADLFFATLAARMLEIAGEEEMPTLDDTIRLVKFILAEQMKEWEIAVAIQALADSLNERENGQ